MTDNSSQDQLDRILSRLGDIEKRLFRIEDYLELRPSQDEGSGSSEEIAMIKEEQSEELEIEVGQTWFAKIGIIVLALGVAFLLTFPYSDIPPSLPSLFGYGLVGGIFLLAKSWRESYVLVSRYLVGGGMALLYFATLRLYFFGDDPVLTTEGILSSSPLLLAVVVNIIIALRRHSPYLLGLSISTGYLTAIITDSSLFLLVAIGGLSILASYYRIEYERPGLLMYNIVLAYFTYLLFILNNPIMGRSVELVAADSGLLLPLLAYALIAGIGDLLRKDHHEERFSDVIITLFNSIGSWSIFLLVTLVGMKEGVVSAHLLATVVYLGLAITYWIHEKSKYATFIYAMIGYMALSVALTLKFSVPDLFIWLSIQSLVVIATAILFRSRFIVVGNFILYVSTFIIYLVVVDKVSLISLSFGIVALLSARILTWQQHRLELKTEMMRNAYLVSAFIIFPYTTFSILPSEQVPFAWVGIAILYYLLNLVVKRQKYRWMGHYTLILTILYVVIVGIVKLDPTNRIISFLLLGVVLVGVSLYYTRVRAKRFQEKRANNSQNSSSKTNITS